MFDPKFFRFFRRLAKNNNREWFNEHKEEYRELVLQPLVDFVNAMQPRLHKISPHFRAIPKTNGGSIFRIYRDVRFSKDKSPYKLHAACHFRHELGKDAHVPGFYVHMSPKEVFFGGGIWLPPAPALNRIRETIVNNPQEWRRIKSNRRLKALCGGIAGDGLTRPPRGYDTDHEHIVDLKRKSFFAMREASPGIIQQDNFVDEVEKTFRAASPLMKYLCFALDAQY